jgi:hypothetical protein
MEEKLSVHISKRRKGAWSRAVFAGIERAGSIKLNAGQRGFLRWETERYVKGYRRWKDKHSKAPRDWIYLSRRSAKPSGRWKRVVMLDPWHSLRRGSVKEVRPLKDEIARLQSLRQGCVDMREGLRRPGRKFNFYLDEFIGRLAIFFIEAGGAWTKVRRVEDPSKISPFLKFAWAVLQQVPSSMRPLSVDALAMAWKRRGLEPTPILEARRPLTPP